MERAVHINEHAPTGWATENRDRLPRLPRSDELLARQVSSGGERPFRTLYERYHSALYRYCYSILRNEADAQDALQSTFTRALVALREGRRNAPLRPWLYRIAHNESVSLVRARRSIDPQFEPAAAAVGPSAAERAHERARFQQLLADLTQLAERSRAALVMRELGGLSHEEIATALQISVGAAKQAIFEARTALLELAEGRATACDEVRTKLSDGDRRTLRGRQLRAHLRDCAPCSAFATAMGTRQAQLRALSPTLAPVAAAAVFSRALEGAAAHGGHAAVGASAASGASGVASTGVTAGASSTVGSAAKVIVAIVTPKALLVTAVIAGAAAGAGGLVVGSQTRGAAPGSGPGGTLGLASPARARVDGTATSSGTSDPRSGVGSHATGASARNTSASAHRPGSQQRAPGTQNNAPQSGGSPGNGANAPGHGSGNARGNSGNAPGNSGNAPGNSGNAPGNSGNAPGNSGNAPGHSGAAPGNSGNAPGHSGAAPGNSGNAPGHTGSSPGNSSDAPGHSGRTPPGLAHHNHTPPGQAKAHGNPHGR